MAKVKATSRKLDLFKKQLQQLSATGLPFQNGKEHLKVSNILGETLTFKDYGFLEGEEGEYLVFTVREEEYEKNFFYGSSVVTATFKEALAMLGEDEEEVMGEGLPFMITEKRSSNKMTYYKLDLCPED